MMPVWRLLVLWYFSGSNRGELVTSVRMMLALQRQRVSFLVEIEDYVFFMFSIEIVVCLFFLFRHFVSVDRLCRPLFVM